MWFPWFEKLRQDSRKTQEMLKEQERSIRDTAESAEEIQREIGVFIAEAIERAAATVPKYEETQRDKEYNLQRRMFWFTVVGTVVAATTAAGAFWYASIAARQLSNMQDTYGQIKQQTQLLQTQVEASMSAMVSKQFRLNWPEPSRAYLSLILDNRGRSIASDVRAKINVSEVSVFNENTAIAQFPDWAFSVREMNPSEGDYILEHGTHLRLSEERFAWPDAIKLTGTVTYFNGFSVRTDELCVYIPGQMTFRDKAGKVQNTYPPNPLGCGQLPPQIAFWRSTQKQVSGLPANH